MPARINCAIVDYGISNLHSAEKALTKVAGKNKITLATTVADIKKADKLVLPGVGAIGNCMAALRERNLQQAVLDFIKTDKPLLAICVGMQMLLDSSEENNGVKGLGILAGSLSAFKPSDYIQSPTYKIPHMGWNRVSQKPHPLWQGIADNSYFYFVHGYYAKPNGVSIGLCDYGVLFSAAVAQDNIFATQFHPEKSDKDGLCLLENFIKWHGNYSCD